MIPSLTLDGNGRLAVYMGRSGKGMDVSKSFQIFRPIEDSDPTGVNVNELAQALEQILKGADLDCHLLMDEREPDEAVVVLLDVSMSMDDLGFVQEDEKDGSNDKSVGKETDDEAQEPPAEGEEGGGGKMPAFPQEGFVPDVLRCPISQNLMLDPVIAADGKTYDRPSITEWMKRHNTSPLTRVPLDPEVSQQHLALER